MDDVDNRPPGDTSGHVSEDSGAIENKIYLPVLSGFDLTHNDLSGCFPERVCNMLNLEWIKLRSTGISAFPKHFFELEHLEVSVVIMMTSSTDNRRTP